MPCLNEPKKKKDRVEPINPGRKHFKTLGAMNNVI